MDASHASVLLPHILWGRSLQNKTLTPTLTQTSRPMSSRHYTSWSWSDAGKKRCVTVVLFIVVLLWSWLLLLWLWLWSAWNKIFVRSLEVPENLDLGTWYSVAILERFWVDPVILKRFCSDSERILRFRIDSGSCLDRFRNDSVAIPIRFCNDSGAIL